MKNIHFCQSIIFLRSPTRNIQKLKVLLTEILCKLTSEAITEQLKLKTLKPTDSRQSPKKADAMI